MDLIITAHSTLFFKKKVDAGNEKTRFILINFPQTIIDINLIDFEITQGANKYVLIKKTLPII